MEIVWVVVTEECGVLDEARVFARESAARRNFREIADELRADDPGTYEENEYAAWTDDFTVAIYEREVE